MGRRFGLFSIFAGILLLLHPALAAEPDNRPARDWPGWAPAADETPNDSGGNVQTDALLDCYAQFLGPDRDVGPPHITYSREFGYILRADFRPFGDSKQAGRILCWKDGANSIPPKYLSLPPLDQPGSSTPDSATQRAFANWQARRAAEAERIAKAQPYPAPDSTATAQLEGIWLIGKEPDKGPCISNHYQGNQIEFEFRKTGGRALYFEPPDLFTAISISGIEKTGDIWTVQARARNGGLRDFLRIRWLAPDRFETLPVTEAAAARAAATNQPPEIAYKCGAPNLSVNADVSVEKLMSLTSGEWTFLEAIPGVSDEDQCQGHGTTPGQSLGSKWIQFELLGPVHYFVFGRRLKPDHKLNFDYVRSIEDKGNGVLVLNMQQHLGGNGWDVEASRGKTYQLTLIDRGGRIEIPELSGSLVRCKSTDPASGGMRRR
jgi:hypothetical protein